MLITAASLASHAYCYFPLLIHAARHADKHTCDPWVSQIIYLGIDCISMANIQTYIQPMLYSQDNGIQMLINIRIAKAYGTFQMKVCV